MGAKGTQTRRALMDATRALLETTALRDLRVAHIVRAARTSSSTFYIYFNDVTDVVLALVGEVTQSPPALLSLVSNRAGQSPAQWARTFVCDYIEHWKLHEPIFRARNLTSDEGDERFQSVRANAILPLLEGMRRRVETRQAAGKLPADLDPRSVAIAVLALLERISVLTDPQLGGRITRAQLIDVAVLFVGLAMGEQPGFPEGVVASAPPKAVRARIVLASPSPAGSCAPKFNQRGQILGRKGDRTQDRIMDATARLLESTSLREISIVDITRASAIRASTFYLYFRDVAEIVLAILSRSPQGNRDLVGLIESEAFETDARRMSERFVADYFADWRKNACIFRARNLASDEGDARFIEARRTSVEPLLDAMEARVARRQASGGFSDALNPHATACALMIMIERLAATQDVPGYLDRSVADTSRAAAYFLAVATGTASASQART